MHRLPVTVSDYFSVPFYFYSEAISNTFVGHLQLDSIKRIEIRDGPGNWIYRSIYNSDRTVLVDTP